MADEPALASVRLDVWLDVACVFKTRSEAQKACDGGKVEVDDQRAKPHRLLHVGDRLRITRGPSRRQMLVVRVLAERHVPKADARQLYEDVTPPPTPEEVAARELERFFWKGRAPATRSAPNRRERQERRRAKEQGL
jgi:ribosome-associated heat shock protein Hsp15